MSGPPPPPPPPPPPAPAPANDAADTGDVSSALFAEINALGEKGARAGLKKGVRGPVNHETPAVSAPPKPAAAPAPKKTIAKGEPVCALQGKKWCVENQYDNNTIEINCESMKQTVYVYRCERSTIQVKGKPNSIAIDSCKKVDLVFEDALSQVEIVNSDSVRVQCTGNAPSINIDGCQSVTYFMSQASVESAMVITSKSAAINLVRPHPDDADDIIETPIAEQFCTTFKNGGFVTEAVDHDD